MEYTIIENKYLGEGMYYIKVAASFEAKMGQFFMLRAWDKYPLLSRPISIFNIDEEGISFIYKVVGEGTKIFASLKAGEKIKLEGPYGNGFEKVQGRVALVGGGVGIAPLYMAAKNFDHCDCYLGFNQEAVMLDEFEKVCDNLVTTKGETLITDVIDIEKYDYILACGPSAMMKKLISMTENTNTKIQVSLENRMACGLGACLVCSCKTKAGNKKTCKDGPVFWGEDVIL